MPSVSVNPPKTPVTKGSNGIACATIPNVCKMPGPPAPFVPVPLPNIGMSGMSPKDYSKDVTFEGNAVAIKGSTFESVGDIASKGTGGGLISANTHGITKFVGPGSMDVKVEGKNVQFLSDPMLNNCGPSGSPPNAATMQGVMQMTGMAALYGDEICPLCGKAHGDVGKLEEDKDTKAEANNLKKAIDQARDSYDDPKPHLSSMIAVVKCKDDGIIFAATSGFQRSDVQKKMPSAWHSPMGVGTLAKRPKKKTKFRAALEDFARYGAGTVGSFSDEWVKLEEKAQESYDGVSDQQYYPPGSCAAQLAVLHALDHFDRPAGLTELFYNSQPSTDLGKLKIRDLGSDGKPMAARFASREELSAGYAIPPCGTCQVILTMLMCTNDKEPKCAHKPPTKAGTCHKC
jgi:hypothetical protein